MFDQVPEIWLKREKPPEFVARPGEVFFFQVCVWSPANDASFGITGEVPALAGRVNRFGSDGKLRSIAPESTIGQIPGLPNAGFTCRKGMVQPGWCSLFVIPEAKKGQYNGSVRVSYDGREISQPIIIKVEGEAVSDFGDSEPQKQTKLRWLDSRIGDSPEVPKPFIPLRNEGRTIQCLGRRVTIGDNGLPESIVTTFNESVTGTDGVGRELLSEPMRLIVDLPDNQGPLPTKPDKPLRFYKWDDDLYVWRASSTHPLGTVIVDGRMEPDGHLEFEVSIQKSAADIRLEIPRTADTCKYSTGLGYYGGAAQLPVDWKWDVKKHQDAHWMGDVNAGLRVRLSAENYIRPMINIHYPRQPLNLPPSWGTGGITVRKTDEKTVLFTAYSGPRTLEPGKPLHFNFDLSITPFKPLNTAAQWKDRYFHSSVQDPAKIKAMGANIINIHQGNELNPYINYPFLTADKLRAYADKVHALGMRVKYYYTIRELSNWTPELFALRSFGSELLAAPRSTAVPAVGPTGVPPVAAGGTPTVPTGETPNTVHLALYAPAF